MRQRIDDVIKLMSIEPIRKRFDPYFRLGIVSKGKQVQKTFVSPFTVLADIHKRYPGTLKHKRWKNVKVGFRKEWKAPVFEIKSLPHFMVSASIFARGYKAKLMRSPERVMGIADAIRANA